MDTYLITGASSGIGLATAKKLSSFRCRLILVARDLNNLRLAKDSIVSEGHDELEVEIISASVSNFDELESKISRVIKHVDYLIHSAGCGYAYSFQNSDLHSFKRVLDTNFMGSVNITTLALQHMIDRGSGRIIYISSVAGLVGIYGYTAYSASKFALEGFAQALRNELAGSEVSIGIVYPPDVDTPMLVNENISKPLVTKKISGGVLLRPEAIAEHIYKHLNKKTFRIFPGIANKINCFFIIYFPRITFFYLDRITRIFKEDNIQT